MSKLVSTQYQISATDTPEEITEAQKIDSPSVIVEAKSDNSADIYIGNDGSDSVDDTTGFPLSPGDQVEVGLGTIIDGPKSAKLFIYGASGNAVSIIASI